MAAGLSPAEGHLVLAYAAIAVYDAAVAVEGGHEPFAVAADAPEGASAEAAVSAAAHRVLLHLLPLQAPALADARALALSTIPDGPAETAGVAVGEHVAATLLALRRDDGFRAPVEPYVVPEPPVPGRWVPTAATPPIGAWLGRMTPFAVRSAEALRPEGPPSLTSRRWARDYAEVARLGSATSTARTPEQTAVARFWGEPPVPQAHGAFRAFVAEHRLGLADAARFLAMVSVTYADAFIACFGSKYDELFWRPVTAIRAGGSDGNARTAPDPAWTPLLPTPNHPEYPSAHSCITPAAGLVVARFLGTHRIDFTMPSVTGLGDRRFATPTALTRDVADGRVWAGLHFRSSVDDGARLAQRTAREVLRSHFRW
ncbi:vanadium-dependent haloperoxidase [Cellulomonas endophytica]|uniref:vanadium-dependent haloperoxidase n=1 Tax=Cellulomonas endophytica TaxID=2494735 RepID=UPI001F0C7E6A|nr:vanadium-dependent haloperoxidase [Cellulomonas endophytica]